MGKGSAFDAEDPLVTLVNQIRALDEARAEPVLYGVPCFNLYALRLNQGTISDQERIGLEWRANTAEGEVQHYERQAAPWRRIESLLTHLAETGSGDVDLQHLLTINEMLCDDLGKVTGFWMPVAALLLVKVWLVGAGRPSAAGGVTVSETLGYAREELHKAERKIRTAQWEAERVAAQRSALHDAAEAMVKHGIVPLLPEVVPEMPVVDWPWLGPLIEEDIKWKDVKKSGVHQPFGAWLVGMTGHLIHVKGLTMADACREMDGIHRKAHEHLIWKHTAIEWKNATRTITNYWNDPVATKKTAAELLVT